MIVTLDGPAGAGKSSTARALAQRLGFRFLDTGAMYRAVALAAMQRRHDWRQTEALAQLAGRLTIEFAGDRVLLDGQDVSEAIRTVEVTAATHYAANNPGVREVLVRTQQQIAGADDIVTEGRDQGTVVFPQAECKIFLTASPEERARRRQLELQKRGQHVELADLLAQQTERDRSDSSREVGPLAAAEDAIEVTTDGLSRAEVVSLLESIVRERWSSSRPNG